MPTDILTKDVPSALRSGARSAATDALVLLALMALALVLRLNGLGSNPLWLDEGYSVWFADRDWGYLWREVPTYETHPVFFYSLLKLWGMVVPRDEVSLRMMVTLLSVLTLPVIYATAMVCGGRAYGRWPATVACLLFACSGTQLFASQDLRPYTLMSFVMALSTLAVAQMVCRSDSARLPFGTLWREDRRTAGAIVLLGASLGLMAWSHNLGLMFCIAYGLCLFLWWLALGAPRALFGNLLIGALVAVLVYAPNIPTIVMQMSVMDSNGFWLEKPTIGWILWDMSKMGFGLDIPRDFPYRVWPVQGAIIGFLGLLGVMALWRLQRGLGRDPGVAVMLPLVAAMPVAIAIVVTFTVQPVFLFRSLQPVQVPAIVVLGFAPLAFTALRVPVTVFQVAACVLAVVLFNGRSADDNFRVQNSWREAVQEIHALDAELGRSVPVLVSPSALTLTLFYYEELQNVDIDIRSIPAPYPNIGEQFYYPVGGAGDAGIDAAHLDPIFAAVADEERIWIVVRNAYLYDEPGLLPAALDANFPCILRQIGRVEHRSAILRARPGPDGNCPAE